MKFTKSDYRGAFETLYTGLDQGFSNGALGAPWEPRAEASTS